MGNTDSLKEIARYDISNMRALIESFPSQCAEARRIGEIFALPERYKRAYRAIVCTGLGGSAIGADLVRSYIADEAAVPLVVNRNYTLPRFVDSSSLVIAASYSGNTEETLAAYRDARAKGAAIISVTSGGELRSLAERDGFPFLTIPAGFPPRCALGYSFFPLLILLTQLGVIKDQAKEIDATIALLKKVYAGELGCAVPERKNIAKKIAGELYRKYPVIYGGQDHIDAVVTRWRGQLAENAKTLSSTHLFPEMNHNEIMGWEYPAKLLKDFVAVILKDAADHPRVAKRMAVTATILKRARVKVITVPSKKGPLLARTFSLIGIGDFVSFYLAILNKRDPTPVERITYLKKELANV